MKALKMDLKVNGKTHSLDVDPDMPLLWVLRDELHITGPKFGCGISMCGACTVHVDGTAVRACSLPVAKVTGEVTTIESIHQDENLHHIQQAWIDQQVAQCGYCQPGQIMSACSLLKHKAKPTDEDINQAMSGNLCRCGTYPRIRKAIKQASGQLAGEPNGS